MTVQTTKCGNASEQRMLRTPLQERACVPQTSGATSPRPPRLPCSVQLPMRAMSKPGATNAGKAQLQSQNSEAAARHESPRPSSAQSGNRQLSSEEREQLEVESKRLEVQRMLRRNRKYFEVVRTRSAPNSPCPDVGRSRSAQTPSPTVVRSLLPLASDGDCLDLSPLEDGTTYTAQTTVLLSPDQKRLSGLASPCRRQRLF
mmetsp:Transcript_72356/g.125454  ORF Transcript_72356/g.125454 Transcript_72356/m.125454 type:complete len:202 (-) Transcript_72356:188-793(-)